jgi:hypothetical protein
MDNELYHSRDCRSVIGGVGYGAYGNHPSIRQNFEFSQNSRKLTEVASIPTPLIDALSFDVYLVCEYWELS